MEWKSVHLFSGLSKTSFKILVRVQLVVMAIGSLLLLSFWANAETCKISKRSIDEVGANNFVVTAGNKETIVISAFESKPEQRKAVEDLLLGEQNIPASDIVKKLEEIFKKDAKAIQILGDTAEFVQNELLDNKINYILVHQPGSSFSESWSTANRLNAMTGYLCYNLDKAQKEKLNKYVRATVGLSAYMNASSFSLFKGVEYAHVEGITPLIKASDDLSPADAKLKELLTSFKDYAGRQNLRTAAQRLKTGGYGKDSDDKIKKDIVTRFGPHSRDKVAEWVDLALAEKTQVIDAYMKSRAQLVYTVLSKPGRGIVLAPRGERFRQIFETFKEACAR